MCFDDETFYADPMHSQIAIEEISTQEFLKLEYPQVFMPLQQSSQYIHILKDSMSRIENARIFIFRNGTDILGHCVLLKKSLFWLWSICSVLRGPVWYKELSHDQIISCLKALFLELKYPKRLLIAPLEQNTSNILQKIFQWRCIAYSDSTAILDLTKTPDQLRQGFVKDWRYSLRKAEGSGITVKHDQSLETLEFLKRKEKQQQSQKNYFRALPMFFETKMYESFGPNSMPCFSAYRNGDLCAGMVFIISNKTALYHMGWANEVGREHSAHNLLLWHAIRHFHEHGLHTLDMDVIDTVNNPGIAHFKLGTNAVLKTYGDIVMPPLIKPYKNC